jgi:hypothetical protein
VVKTFLLLAVTSLMLGACSPAAYKVNSPTSQQDLPGSEEEGYMRILADLSWDQLTSKADWIKRFPNCLSDKYQDHSNAVNESDYLNNLFPIIPSPSNGKKNRINVCRGFIVGGVSISPSSVFFAQNTGTNSNTMTRSVTFGFLGVDSKSRAFKSAIAQKYPLTTSGYCSKFTCWDLGDVDEPGDITANPTPYTVSILDNVKIDKSDI